MNIILLANQWMEDEIVTFQVEGFWKLGCHSDHQNSGWSLNRLFPR